MKNEKTVSAVDNNPVSLQSAAIALVLSVCMSLGFMVMLATAFRIEHKLGNVFIYSLIVSAVFCFCYYFKNKWLTMTCLILPTVVLGLLILTDIWGVGTGLLQFIENFEIYATLWFLENNTVIAEKSTSVMAFFYAYNLISISVTTYALMRRKFILPSLISYLPFFICSVINTAKMPDQLPVVIASAGFIGALAMHFTRKKKREIAEKMMIFLAAPVLSFGLIMMFLYPADNYDKNTLATEIIAGAKEAIDRASSDKDSLLAKLIDIAENGWRGSSFSSGGGQFASLYATTTYLNDVGPFNPSSTEVLKTYKRYNSKDGYPSPASGHSEDFYLSVSQNDDTSSWNIYYNENTIYLKVESLDKYENNRLSASDMRINPYPGGLGFPQVNDSESEYILTVTPLQPCLVDIVPYYTDWYVADVREIKHVNPYLTTSGGDDSYAFSPVPLKTGNIYSEKYLETYVYGVALQVPEATEKALITSGSLPQWYMDAYYGNSDLSDADKVRKVTEFVSQLHPYDKDTKYPPKGKDFVPWFVSEAESGICVHYAATSMILLRMLGVPARYVRGYVDTGAFVNNESTVYSSQGHAWFEVFIPEYGWVMGDATPGYSVDASGHNIDAVANIDPSVNDETIARERTPLVSSAESGYRAPSERSSDGTPRPSSAPISPAGTNPSLTPAPSATPTPKPTPKPSGKGVSWIAESDEKVIVGMLIVFLAIFLIVLLCLITKAVFFLYWTASFKTKDINSRAIAYYRLYKFTCRFVGGTPVSEARKIAEKAAFSGAPISQEEYDELLSLCKRYTFEISSNLLGPKWLIYKILTVKIRE